MSWLRKIIEYYKGLKLCPQSAGSKNGFALITVIIILTIMGISAGIAGIFSSKILYTRSERINRDALNVLKEAITGNPRVRVNGGRADFGFCGNMGNVPTSLEELYKMGSQPAYTYNTAKKVGAGWKGPYIDPFIIEYIENLKEDAFGNDYVYSTTQYTRADGEVVVAKITSKGVDDILDTDDRYVEILKGEVFSTVTGKVTTPNGDVLQNAYITINMPKDGALTTQFTWTDLSGNYTFSDVPFGINSIEILATEATENEGGLVYVTGSALAKGAGATGTGNDTVEFMLSNIDATDITVTGFTAVWTATGKYFSKVLWRDESAEIPEYVTIWDYTIDPADELRAESGEEIILSPSQDMSGMAGMTLAATTEIVHVDETSITAHTSILGMGAGAGGQVTIQLLDFANNRSGGGGNPSMESNTFTITFATSTGVYIINFDT